MNLLIKSIIYFYYYKNILIFKINSLNAKVAII